MRLPISKLINTNLPPILHRFKVWSSFR